MAGSTFTLKLSPRLFADGEKCFGPGAAELLEGVDREGSLRGAAGGMGMSYSNAWTTLRECERALGFPLLERKAGGPAGGCSVLTPRGRALLEGYRRLEARLAAENASLLEEVGRLKEE
ncbi:LysR family transcriptional regulator [Oscillibacter sp.]|uniref:winged helix-turn-helix domain-containing protein n=1 Tax=Oscillibacter sp. TaxID=1945593 RepID=UPI0026236065|nr:LysR family transcriptional regulator [Oscillibacter sp.]MDD3346586.1 LysR family transcriptional regulator [Oscillibacter sp.]